ncbi:uncharacterized protein [Nicotiana tomentosiformis]|uniref:uncharacterized protein n=1 Tax=Nicotiana tomentosiformis TaxID=4098 RepID=UPI00388C75D7
MGNTSASEFEFTARASSPLFLHPSDVPGASLVSVPFYGSGFGGWKRSMTVSLLARNKIAFVDGTCPRPASNSYECSLDIASYFKKIKKLWDELGIMSSNHAKTCTCAAKTGLQVEEEENRVHQFLMGLNETYVNVRSNILLMNPQPSLDNRQYTQKDNFDQFNQRMSFEQNKGSLFCKYCKKNGHTIDKCYKLHGFPQNFKFTKGRKFGAAANIESPLSGHFSRHLDNASSSGSGGQNSPIPGLTKAYNALN